MIVHGSDQKRAGLGQCAFRDSVNWSRGIAQRQEVRKKKIETREMERDVW